MMRVIPWTQSGGRGLTPSIHGAPPIRLLAVGNTLAETLGLNLVPFAPNTPAGTASWSGAFKPGDFGKAAAEWFLVPYMEALTWNPRLISIPTPEEGWDCWRCGAGPESYTVGKIAYKKNDNTQKPQSEYRFIWRDPAAFYQDVPPDATKKERELEYVTVKSANERTAFLEGDTISLLFPEEGPCPVAAVQRENPKHLGWGLFIPCTNAANNKAFDVRMIRVDEFSKASLEQIRLDMPEKIPKSLDGWRAPPNPPSRSQAFIRATQRLTDTDWASLASADRSMNKSPEAFDLFSGLYWGLRNKNRPVPSRRVAWLILKLMASVPARLRTPASGEKWSPLDELKRRQPLPRADYRKGVLQEYPIRLPDTHRLEMQLREIFRTNTCREHPKPINWRLLSDQIDNLLGR